MADTIRKQIIDRLVARMETIHSAAGYNTNLGAHVAHWRLANWPDGDLPGLNIKDTASDRTHSALRQYNNKITADLVIRCAAGIDTAYQLIADVYAACAIEDNPGTPGSLLDGLAQNIEPLGEEIDIDQAENTIAQITIRIEIHYETDKWQI